MKNPIISMTCLAVLFCFGCNTSSPTAVSDGLESRSLADLAGLARAESEEVSFCLDEGAGFDSLQESVDRLEKVVQALPGSVAAAGLPAAKTDEANKAIEALTKGYDSLASSIKSQASPKEISKVNSKIRSEIKKLTKLSR